MTKRIWLVVPVVLGVALLVLAVYQILAARRVGPASGGTHYSGAAKMIDMSRAQRLEEFERWSKTQYVFASADEASRALSFRLRLPRCPEAGRLLGIYVGKEKDLKQREARALFDDPVDGLELTAESRPKLDFEGIVAEEVAEKKAGYLKADRLSVLVKIHGCEGYGSEPGYNVIGNEKVPRRGFVAWWDDGVHYTIGGTPGPNGTSLAELLRIAESMYQ